MNPVHVGDRPVGPEHPCLVIAEAGVNHDGDVEQALELVDAAADAGADAVKFQTYHARELATATAPKAAYQGGPEDEPQVELLQRLELTRSEHRTILQHCRDQGIVFLSTPFDAGSLRFLHELDVPAIKVGSGDLTNHPLLQEAAGMKRPLLVSTGMATLADVEDAVHAIETAGNPPLVLLHCVSNYPADPAHVNLRAMDTLRTAFQVPVGYSDHTLGLEVPLAAVARGANVIEKHFTLDRDLPGPDHEASIEPPELTALVQGIRKVEAALGTGRKTPAPGEGETAAVARKSLVTATHVPEGTTLTREHLTTKRPGTGLPPNALDDVLGRTTRKDLPEGTLLTWEVLA